MRHRPTRRSFLLGATGAAAAATLAACGSDGDPSTATGPAAGSFPVTVRDRYGTTTVERAPERVVSYGFGDHDTMLALGVVPVALIRWAPDSDLAVGPWSRRALGDARPALFQTGIGVDFERIAALRPDLIVAVNNDLPDDDRDRLARLAPIVSTPAGYPPFGLPQEVQALQVGVALGLRGQAQALVARADRAYAAVRRANPAFAGRRAMAVTPVPDGQIRVYAPTDPRGRFVSSLGLRHPDRLAGLLGDRFYLPISPERFDLIDVDALIVLDYYGTAKALLAKLPTFAKLGVVRRGAVVHAGVSHPAMALAAGGVASVPAALGAVVPQLRSALAA